MLLLTVIIYMLLQAEEKPCALASWAGLPVALRLYGPPYGFIIRFDLDVYVAVRHRRYLIGYLLAAARCGCRVHLGITNPSITQFCRRIIKLQWSGFLPGNWETIRRRAGRQSDQSIARTIYLHASFSIRDLGMIRRKWFAPIAPWLAVLALAHWIAISSYARQLVGWPMLRAALLYRPDAGLHPLPDPLFPELDRLFARGVRIKFGPLALIGFAMHLRRRLVDRGV